MATPIIGQIVLMANTFPPEGWADCNGQLLGITAFPALFSLIGTTYGGDGKTTFGLPDLRGRVPIHQGTGGGLTQRRPGQRFGEEKVALTTNHMPSHNHAVFADAAPATVIDPEDQFLAETATGPADRRFYSATVPADRTLNAATVGMTGLGTGHENMMPFQVLRYYIALTGIFPSRP